jgi:hypothetical protein
LPQFDRIDADRLIWEGHGLGSDSKEQEADDLWELTLDDLFSSSTAAASELRDAVPGPFAIDLCTSIEPASELAPSLQAFEHLHAYQVTDWKDDQLVFRLRLGPIDSELEADAILSIVRSDYPDATTVPVSDDDQRMIALVAASAPVRNATAPPEKPAAVAKVAKAAQLERGGNAESVAPAATAEESPKPASSRDRVVPAAKPAVVNPVAAPAAEKPGDFAELFRDLAAELLTPTSSAAGPGRSRRSAAPVQEPLAASATPPVLTAAVQGRHSSRSADRSRKYASAQPQSDASPPVLRIDTVARPPRERAERRAIASAAAPAPLRAATPSAPNAVTPTKRESAPVAADQIRPSAAAQAPLAAKDGAVQASRPAAESLASEPAVPQISVAPPVTMPEATGAAPADAPAAPAAPIAAARGTRTAEPSRAAPARASHAPATAAPAQALAAGAPSADRLVTPTTAATPSTAGVANLPSPSSTAPAAIASEPRRSVVQRAPAPTAARERSQPFTPNTSASRGATQPAGASESPAVPASRMQAEPVSPPKSHEPPRVALRPEPAPSKAAALPAESAPAGRRMPEPPSPVAEPPRVTALAAPATATMPHAAAERPPALKFDLELLPDDLSWATDTIPATLAVASPARGASTSEPARVTSPSLPLELVPDAPRAPAPSATTPAPPIAPRVANQEPARIQEPSSTLQLVADAPQASPDPNAQTTPMRQLTTTKTATTRSPVAPTATAAATRTAQPARPITPTPAVTARPPPAKSGAVAPKTVTPQRTYAPSAPAPKPAATAARPQLPAKPAARATPAPAAAAAARTPAPPAAPTAATPVGPSIESTQTLRALVVPDHPAAATEKLLVVQLLVSELEIQPDSVPNLAIFNEYRLYSAVGYDQGKVKHALRLGFFTDDAPAEAVAGYLRAYFEAAAVTRVSFEERERFGKRRVSARKDSGDTGLHAAIELSSAPIAPTTSLADLSARSRAELPPKPGNERKRG